MTAQNLRRWHITTTDMLGGLNFRYVRVEPPLGHSWFSRPRVRLRPTLVYHMNYVFHLHLCACRVLIAISPCVTLRRGPGGRSWRTIDTPCTPCHWQRLNTVTIQNHCSRFLQVSKYRVQVAFAGLSPTCSATLITLNISLVVHNVEAAATTGGGGYSGSAVH